MQVSNLFVCLMGMGVTFFGLTCLILLITLMGKIVGGKQGAEAPSAAAPAPAPVSAPAAPAAPAPVVNRQAVIAAVSAVIAEELGTDVSAIRIRSFKQIGGTAPCCSHFQPSGNGCRRLRCYCRGSGYRCFRHPHPFL